MTAKELKDIREMKTHPMTDSDGKIIKQNESLFWFNESDLNEFINQLCKEQREICSDVYDNYEFTPNSAVSNMINDAKMPEL